MCPRVGSTACRGVYLSGAWIFVDLGDEIGAIGGLLPRAAEGLSFVLLLEDGLGGVFGGWRGLRAVTGEI